MGEIKKSHRISGGFSLISLINRSYLEKFVTVIFNVGDSFEGFKSAVSTLITYFLHQTYTFGSKIFRRSGLVAGSHNKDKHTIFAGYWSRQFIRFRSDDCTNQSRIISNKSQVRVREGNVRGTIYNKAQINGNLFDGF